MGTMRAAGYDLRETGPFEQQSSLSFSRREQSPYVNRIRLMWQDMRETVIAHFPTSSSQTVDKTAYMQHVEDVYVTDAYHSLSIEGYSVTPELINRVRTNYRLSTPSLLGVMSNAKELICLKRTRYARHLTVKPI